MIKSTQQCIRDLQTEAAAWESAFQEIAGDESSKGEFPDDSALRAAALRYAQAVLADDVTSRIRGMLGGSGGGDIFDAELQGESKAIRELGALAQACADCPF